MSCSNIGGRKNICDHLFWHTDYGYRNMFWQNVVFRNCDVSNKTPCNPASPSHSNSCSDRKPTNESRMFSSEDREVHADFGTITDVLIEPLVNFCMLTFVDIKEAVGMERVFFFKIHAIIIKIQSFLLWEKETIQESKAWKNKIK